MTALMNDEYSTAVPLGVEDLCRQTAELIDAANGPLKRVRVQAGDIIVEVEWPEQGAPAALVPQVAVPPQAVLPQAVLPQPTVVQQPTVVEQQADAGEAVDAPETYAVSAPLVGTFYRSPAPGARAFVEVGDVVEAGQQVAIVEAMKLMNSVEADRPGRVVEVLVEDGKPVEYGEPLVLLAPVQ